MLAEWTGSNGQEATEGAGGMSDWVMVGEALVVCCRTGDREEAEEVEGLEGGPRLIGRGELGSHCCSCGYGGEVEGVDESLKWAWSLSCAWEGQHHRYCVSILVDLLGLRLPSLNRPM